MQCDKFTNLSFFQLKREIEDLKQQVYRLENKHKDVLEELKEERESIKRRDPEIVKELEKRHRATISEIKRKQWVGYKSVFELFFLICF